VIGSNLSGGQAHDPEHFYAAAIYGSILAAAFITVFREEHSSPETVALAVFTTMLVFWLAHVWSSLLGERIHRRDEFTRDRVSLVARREWPLLEATLAPCFVLVLGWTGLLGEHAAEEIALAVCFVQLFAWGLYVGLRIYDRWRAALASGLINFVLGLTVVTLEILIVH
jgi:hypothetical protein